MAELPKNAVGTMTQSIMDRIDERLPDLSTHVYNRVCEGILDGLKNTSGVAVVEDNDWAFMAKLMEMPVKTRQEFYRLCRQMFPEAFNG